MAFIWHWICSLRFFFNSDFPQALDKMSDFGKRFFEIDMGIPMTFSNSHVGNSQVVGAECWAYCLQNYVGNAKRCLPFCLVQNGKAETPQRLEHKNEGLVQMIFLCKWVTLRFQPLLNKNWRIFPKMRELLLNFSHRPRFVELSGNLCQVNRKSLGFTPSVFLFNNLNDKTMIFNAGKKKRKQDVDKANKNVPPTCNKNRPIASYDGFCRRDPTSFRGKPRCWNFGRDFFSGNDLSVW